MIRNYTARNGKTLVVNIFKNLIYNFVYFIIVLVVGHWWLVTGGWLLVVGHW